MSKSSNSRSWSWTQDEDQGEGHCSAPGALSGLAMGSWAYHLTFKNPSHEFLKEQSTKHYCLA
jgi:hypothetical protein